MEHASYKLSAAKTIHIKMLLQISLGPSFRTYLLKRKEWKAYTYIYITVDSGLPGCWIENWGWGEVG